LEAAEFGLQPLLGDAAHQVIVIRHGRGQAAAAEAGDFDNPDFTVPAAGFNDAHQARAAGMAALFPHADRDGVANLRVADLLELALNLFLGRVASHGGHAVGIDCGS
jgi:hypothetical protein